MNEKELSQFILIAEEKNLSRAAKKLFISQPALSQALNKIEESIGTPLFLRTPRGMRLTEAGEIYYMAAKKILSIYDDMENEIRYRNEISVGRVNIGTINFLGCHDLPEVLPDFIRDHPGVSIQILERTAAELEELLLAGEIDFALMHIPLKPRSSLIDYYRIKRDRFVLCKPKGDRTPLLGDRKRLRTRPYVVLDETKHIRSIQDVFFAEEKFEPNVTLTTRNAETAYRLVSRGVGYSVLPLQYCRFFERESAFEVELEELPRKSSAFWTTSIATLREGYLSRPARLLISQIEDYIRRTRPEDETRTFPEEEK